MTLPSIELLNEVLGLNVVAVDTSETDSRVKENTIRYMYKDKYFVLHGLSETETINIHELAFRVRDYFAEKGKFLTLNQPIEAVFIEANKLYELNTD